LLRQPANRASPKEKFSSLRLFTRIMIRTSSTHKTYCYIDFLFNQMNKISKFQREKKLPQLKSTSITPIEQLNIDRIIPILLTLIETIQLL